MRKKTNSRAILLFHISLDHFAWRKKSGSVIFGKMHFWPKNSSFSDAICSGKKNHKIVTAVV